MSVPMNLEDQLREALRAEAPPAGFAARVMERATPWWRRPGTLAMAAALGVLAIIPPAVSEYRQQRAKEAHEQLMTALSITRTQIRHVTEQIQETTRRPL